MNTDSTPTDRPPLAAARSPAALAARAGGFTLVELMVTILVGAILLGIAVPALQNLATANQIVTATDTFASALNLARSEAIKLGTPVGLVSKAGATSQNWSGGWTMFVDQNGNQALDNGETTVRDGAAQASGVQLQASSSLTGLIEFDANGRLMNATAGQFIVCQNSGPPSGSARMVTVKATGRVRIAANNASGWPMYDDSTVAATSCTP